jgi:hypothetical protein
MADDDHKAPKLASYPAAPKNAMALDRSRINVLNAVNLNRQATSILWAEASKSPLYQQKRAQREDEHGNKLPFPVHPLSGKVMMYRSNRALSGNTLKTMASGAGASIAAQLTADCATLRTGHTKGPEDPKYPLLPTFTAGASMAIEAAYIAYMQELFHTACVMKNMVGKHKKVTAKGCQAAAEIVNRQLAAGTAFVPPVIAFRKPTKTIKKESKAARAAKKAVAAAAAPVAAN